MTDQSENQKTRNPVPVVVIQDVEFDEDGFEGHEMFCRIYSGGLPEVKKFYAANTTTKDTDEQGWTELKSGGSVLSAKMQKNSILRVVTEKVEPKRVFR